MTAKQKELMLMALRAERNGVNLTASVEAAYARIVAEHERETRQRISGFLRIFGRDGTQIVPMTWP